MINVILSGGSGSRLWPLSRVMLPKQFVPMFENKSLFQEVLIRNQDLCSSTCIVTNVEQYFLAADQFLQVSSSPSRFLLEPVGRNTAPAIALACLTLDPDELVLVTSSDHLIKDQKAYDSVVLKAKALAEQGNLVTFGIQPTYPETGFGYIEAKGNEVLSFKEKPPLELAKRYIEQGNYFWNSGMFCFKAGVFLSELQQYAPDIYQACVKALDEQSDHKEVRIDLKVMQEIPAESIDYAVMEKSNKVKMVPCDMGWSDLGSFDALYDETKTEMNENVVLARTTDGPEPICIDSSGNLLITLDRQIALVDIDDLVIVDTADAILVSKKGCSEKIKQVVAQVKKQKPELAEIHRLVQRPWGTYEVLATSASYKVKRLVVNPGSKLSLQKHYHRNEHWIVVSGTATVTVGDKHFLVRPNESTYIQMGKLHRLANNGKIDLVMIEAQVGEYTGEDDIVRIEE
ncbi:MAG: mannose-1-phosphate guanylyltransferase/mannose-6-phosphate isomerase [Methylococcales symbiont of Hymedesmia sp. n. MRB-2018]|nr:MAG: mannose-1-phosphate guanylyltransferase/mannose-6-phosphate isomerase [Methylococcales symbiont of Hymedesmia sp. n. MRB-2018]KAF3984307.1 MAG: mannose-1-phosphate guanylyltransferase/mannose-6-phosphate isomerase [Methylococcales symbiont of Hymedesmia sp. n. MRB-2018]